MKQDRDWVPEGVDTAVPNAARAYDHWLGGSHNFAADRALADNVQQIIPEIRDAARVSRAFLRRAVLFLVERGVRQFLDIGSGIPTVGNVHDVAQGADPGCRIVYVDQEPIAVAHSKLLLEGNDRAAAIQANLRDVEEIVEHPQTTRLLDFDQPVGLLLMLMLHFVPDSWDPAGILGRYRDRLTPGSYLALSHVTADGNPAGVAQAVQLYQDTPNPLHPRSHDEVLRLFSGFELVEPGLVDCAVWRPAGPTNAPTANGTATLAYGGIGRKP